MMDTGSGQRNRRYGLDVLNIDVRHRGLRQIGVQVRVDEFDVGIGGRCGHRLGERTRWNVWPGQGDEVPAI